MNYALYTVAALTILGALVNIAKIGKAREPLTAGTVAVSTALNAVIVTVLILAALRLH